MIAKFGNTDPLHDVDPTATEHVTYIEFPEGISEDEAFINVTDPSGVWTAQSGAKPSWIACSDPDLEARLCAYYNCSAQVVSGVNS
jgi:hypothetical protein